MKNIFILLTLFLILGCSAPQPSKIHFKGKMNPINFNDNLINDNAIIKSSKILNYYNMKFAYYIDDIPEYSPRFFFAITHADKIVAHIKPPFVEYSFLKVQEKLRNYGVTANIELCIEEENKQGTQIILECLKTN
jgi:hypothetical protein